MNSTLHQRLARGRSYRPSEETTSSLDRTSDRTSDSENVSITGALCLTVRERTY